MFLFTEGSIYDLRATRLYTNRRRVISQDDEAGEHEVDHLPSSSARIKNVWVHTSTAPYLNGPACN